MKQRPQTTCLHPALSCAAASIFLQLHLKPAVQVSFSRSLFHVFFGRSLFLTVSKMQHFTLEQYISPRGVVLPTFTSLTCHRICGTPRPIIASSGTDGSLSDGIRGRRKIERKARPTDRKRATSTCRWFQCVRTLSVNSRAQLCGNLPRVLLQTAEITHVDNHQSRCCYYECDNRRSILYASSIFFLFSASFLSFSSSTFWVLLLTVYKAMTTLVANIMLGIHL